MNLGIERFLILGCIAVLIVEVPQLMRDWRMGDGFVAGSIEAPSFVLELEGTESNGVLLGQLAVLVAEEPIMLPSTPGL